jgi:hypothetical protein
MNNADDVIYTNGYKPKEDACVELYNGKFVDVANARYLKPTHKNKSRKI